MIICYFLLVQFHVCLHVCGFGSGSDVKNKMPFGFRSGSIKTLGKVRTEKCVLSILFTYKKTVVFIKVATDVMFCSQHFGVMTDSSLEMFDGLLRSHLVILSL